MKAVAVPNSLSQRRRVLWLDSLQGSRISPFSAPRYALSRLLSKHPPWVSAPEAPGLVAPAEKKRLIQGELKVDFAVHRKRSR